MNKKNNVFFKALSFITYKEEKEKYNFYIPEVNNPQEVKDRVKGKSTKSKEKQHSSGIKKPTPVSNIIGQKHSDSSEENKDSIPQGIEKNIELIKSNFNFPDNKDIVFREFTIADKHKAFIVYIDGMVDRITINNFILRPLMNEVLAKDEDNKSLEKIVTDVVETNQLKKVEKLSEVIKEILAGDTGLFIDGCDSYFFSETKGYDKRSVDKPVTEGVVKGSQEAFNENLRTNTTLIRRIIKNKDLTTEFLTIGERNNNACAIMYLKEIVNPAIVEEIKRRINGIKTDYILGTEMLEQFIEDNHWSLIPNFLSTERPDRVAAGLLEGRVAIMCEGMPFALVVPITITTLLHSPEDMNLRWQYGNLIRIIRLFAIFVAIFLPGLYVALTNFHREMIPTDLLVAIAIARENVPFPTIVEIILMEASFELIREAGIRIPGIIGNTLGIIGALILGQASVQANLVSPVIIVIVAFTGLGNFAIPDFSLAFGVRILRITFIIAGATFGFYGISLCLLVFMGSLTNSKSFGVPMFSVIAPKTSSSSDSFIRYPIWKQEKRPDYLNPLDVRRQPKISMQWQNQYKEGNKEGDNNNEGK